MRRSNFNFLQWSCLLQFFWFFRMYWRYWNSLICRFSENLCCSVGKLRSNFLPIFQNFLSEKRRLILSNFKRFFLLLLLSTFPIIIYFVFIFWWDTWLIRLSSPIWWISPKIVFFLYLLMMPISSIAFYFIAWSQHLMHTSTTLMLIGNIDFRSCVFFMKIFYFVYLIIKIFLISSSWLD